MSLQGGPGQALLLDLVCLTVRHLLQAVETVTVVGQPVSLEQRQVGVVP